MKESHCKEVETTKMVKVEEIALDVKIQIISSGSVQSRQEIIIKALSLEGYGAIVGKDEEEKTKDETCLVAQASNEICLRINLKPTSGLKIVDAQNT
ncbi:hypothetical protein Tco_1543622 [Tanacetum coccineum]